MTVNEFIPTPDFAFDVQESGPSNYTLYFTNINTNTDIEITVSLKNLLQIRNEITNIINHSQ
jgi:hypothetical protein